MAYGAKTVIAPMVDLECSEAGPSREFIGTEVGASQRASPGPACLLMMLAPNVHKARVARPRSGRVGSSQAQAIAVAN